MELFKNMTPNARALAKAQARERIDAARAVSLVKREELGMGKTAKVALALNSNARNTAKLSAATERSTKLGLTKKR